MHHYKLQRNSKNNNVIICYQVQLWPHKRWLVHLFKDITENKKNIQYWCPASFLLYFFIQYLFAATQIPQMMCLYYWSGWKKKNQPDTGNRSSKYTSFLARIPAHATQIRRLIYMRQFCADALSWLPTSLLLLTYTFEWKEARRRGGSRVTWPFYSPDRFPSQPS